MNLSASDQILVSALSPYIQKAKESKTNTVFRFHKPRCCLSTTFLPILASYGLTSYFSSSGWLEFDYTTNKVHIVVITKNSICKHPHSKVKNCYALDGTIDDDNSIKITSQKEVVIKRMKFDSHNVQQMLEKIKFYISIQKLYNARFPEKVSDAPKLFPAFIHNGKHKIELEQKKYDGDLGKLAKTLDFCEMNRALLDCADVLSALHRDNYAHCDAKLFNIFLNQKQASLADWEYLQQCGTYRDFRHCYYFGWDCLNQMGIATPFTDVWAMTMTLGMLYYGKPFSDCVKYNNNLTQEFLKNEYENGTSWIMQQEFDDDERRMNLLLNKRLYMWISTIFTQEKMIKEYIEAHPTLLQDFILDTPAKQRHLEKIAAFCCSMQDFISVFSNIIKT